MFKTLTAIAVLATLLSIPVFIAADRTPVLVELFTSEGCDSCPPADEVLIRLARQRSVAGTDLIVMSEHVDYWNDLGWKDPYSSSAFTERQQLYGNVLGRGNIYTPEAVIDGRFDVLGSNYGGVVDAIARAARIKKGVIMAASRWRGDMVEVEVSTQPMSEAANVYLAVTEDNLSNKVTRGENKGKTLAHIAVVRRLMQLGYVKPNTPFAIDRSFKLQPEWKSPDLRIVAFAQSDKSRAVLSATEIGF